MSSALLEARGLNKQYAPREVYGSSRTPVKALEDVHVKLFGGRTLGVVGESGSGKSTLAKVLTLIEEPDAGELFFEGKPLLQSDRNRMRRFRRKIQMVFQDPWSSLSPRLDVRQILSEPFEIHPDAHARVSDARVRELLNQVGLEAGLMNRVPAELSGGQRQRVSIARALALKPDLIILDEPVSSLDAIVQAEILNLLLELQKKHGFGYLFISHDLGVIAHMSDELVVMQEGRVVESGAAEAVYRAPQHPYTRALLQSADLSDLA